MAEKLKGLLDTARAKLTGLLGDFPAGFNSGAAAGFPGWAGDMAYMADTARLALTGADQQAAPENYIGTTEYIAKQAGYPVPQTLSGQLGAAVGGLMSPGPGDLAKFAPLGAMFLGAKAKTAMPDVLEYAQAMEAAGKSADEIWQTTGKLGQPWFKGADGKWRFEISDKGSSIRMENLPERKSVLDIANEYLHSQGIPPNRDMGSIDSLVSPQLKNEALLYAKNKVETTPPPSAPIARVLNHGALWMNYPELMQLPVSRELSNTVRGRYDPQAKAFTTGGGDITSNTPEAAHKTLLHEVEHAIQDIEGFAKGGSPSDFTLERFKYSQDMQRLAARDALDEYAKTNNGWPTNAEVAQWWESTMGEKLPDWAIDDARQMDAGDLQKRVNSYYDTFKALPENASEVDAYKRLAGETEARNVPKRMNLASDEITVIPPWSTQDVPTEQQIVRFGDGPAMAIEDFAARRAGKAKPYKELAMDEASRMQRAKEMGFDTPAVHWSRHGVDVNELDSGKFAIAPFDAVGTHVGTPEAAMKRFEGWASPERGAGVTYPVVIKSKKPYLDPSGKPWNEQQLTEHLREIGGYDSARASYKELNSKLREKIFADYDSIPYINDVEDAGSISYIAPPQNIRSRFAAFDPSKKDSANLLAGAAATALGLGLAKQQLSEQERRNGM